MSKETERMNKIEAANMQDSGRGAGYKPAGREDFMC